MTQNRLLLTQLALLGAAIGIAACDAADEPPTEFGPDTHDEFDPEIDSPETSRVADIVTRVSVAEGASMTASVAKEARQLQLRFANSLIVARGAQYFLSRTADDEAVHITYLGRGKSIDNSPEVAPEQSDLQSDYVTPERYADGARWIVGFNPETGNEFEVRIPDEFAEAVGEDGEARGLNYGSTFDDEKEEQVLYQLVGDQDNRSRKGSLNTRQSYSR